MLGNHHPVTEFVVSGDRFSCRACSERVVVVHADDIEPVPGRMGCVQCDFVTTVDAGGLALLADHLANGHPKWRLKR